MLRERLKFMDLRITELADYLQISRPTMYKFIDYYESGNFELINGKVLKLFNYITENELVGKKNVINFVLTNLVELKEMGDKEENSVLKAFKKIIISNPESKKSKFLEFCVTKNEYDKVIFYLADISNLIGRKKLDESEAEMLQPYLEFINKIDTLNKNQGE